MEKTEEQIAREKASVDAMKNAKASMTGALDRIATLERALASASMAIGTLKGYIAPGVYVYPHSGDTRKPCIDVATDAMAAIAKVMA